MAFHRIVVKLGTSTLTAGTPRLSMPYLVDIARQLAALRAKGTGVVLVTSGAMAAGRERLGFPSLPKGLPAKQMLAAIGQPRLMALYEQVFGMFGLVPAQVLLTRADLSERRRYLNSRNTLTALLDYGAVPVINENDTVATEEIRIGENDNLSALAANLIDADLLLLLTDQSGLYTADPRSDPEAILVNEVSEPEIPEALWKAAGGTDSGLGTGGMLTKLQAADLARRSGTTVIIASGDTPDVLLRAAAGDAVGTRFRPVATSVESRKRYILAGGRAAGSVRLDSGAVKALAHGSSLLPVGVNSVDGSFERGDSIRVLDPDGKEIARGIANYGSGELSRIIGKKSDEIESILGFNFGDEVIHRNDLVLL
ncbi:MAG: glutamate 5-kinase [Anaerolineales bacterium]|nr:glutamate 5-kinase [Anaerolineales bacterium]